MMFGSCPECDCQRPRQENHYPVNTYPFIVYCESTAFPHLLPVCACATEIQAKIIAESFMRFFPHYKQVKHVEWHND